MHYTEPTTIITNTGNNAFSFDERSKILGSASIHLSTGKTINSIDDVCLGDHIVFEEVDHHGKLRQCTGLAHLYTLGKYKIFDNHNHALYFWAQHALSDGPMTVIHIDQHSDLATPTQHIEQTRCHDLAYIWEYTNIVCNVGNFINPALEAGIIKECIQIRTETALSEQALPQESFILDIDLDFRAPAMSITDIDTTIAHTKALINQATLVTIATSPYFLEQHTALELLHRLFNKNH